MNWIMARSAPGDKQDSMIVRDVLLGLQPDTPPPDLIVLVADATHLDRHLYLALQVIEIGRPVILALNMMDVAEANGVRIDERALEQQLGVPVVGISATKGTGLGHLRRLMDRDVEPSTRHFRHVTVSRTLLRNLGCTTLDALHIRFVVLLVRNVAQRCAPGFPVVYSRSVVSVEA